VVGRRYPTLVVASGIGALFLVRLLPASGLGLWLRLALATALLLAPGVHVAAALGQPLVSGAVVWTLGFAGLGMAAMFAVRGSLWLALALAGVAAVGAVAAAARWSPSERPHGMSAMPIGVIAAGLLIGALVWPVTGPLNGDALFHLARIRKLLSFGSLSLLSVDEFRDGGLHPGYAFPLWHGLIAFVTRLAGVDPGLVVRRESCILMPIAFAVAYEAGVAVFRSASLGDGVLVIQVVLYGLAPGHGGTFTSLALPATIARQVLVPALVALFFTTASGAARRGRVRRHLGLLAVVLMAVELALVHVTYALFTLIVLAGFVVAQLLVRSDGLRRSGTRLVAAIAGAGAVVAWLAPIASTTRAHNPNCAEVRRAFSNYGGEIIHGSCTHYRLSPEMVTRSGALAVAGLLLVPLAAFGARRDWGALVLGGTTAMLILLLVPWVFPHFADAVSISQARRAAGFLPLPFAAVGGLAMLGRGRGQLAVALALAAGIGLELLYPGWFGSAAPRGAPSYPAWVALGGGIAVLLLAGMLPSNRSRPRGGLTLVLVALVAAPAAVRGLSEWTTTPQPTSSPLTDGVVRELRTARFRGTIVYSDPGTSYWIASAAPVFIATAPPSHVANTIANDPYRRWDAGARFLRTGSLAIPRRYRACTILLRRPARIRLHLPVIYRDTGFVLYALQPNCSQTD